MWSLTTDVRQNVVFSNETERKHILHVYYPFKATLKILNCFNKITYINQQV